MHAFFLAASSMFLAAAASANSPTLVRAPVEKVFSPLGFDDNDISEVVVHGHFPTSCYKTGSATATPDVKNHTITLDVQSWLYEGEACANILVPFTQSIKLGPIPAGEYQIRVLEQPEIEPYPLKIETARTRSPDDYLYAPVESVSITKATTGDRRIVIEGNYPFTFIGCMKIIEVRKQITPGNVILLQPIAQLFEDEADCVGLDRTMRFKIEQPLNETLELGEYLAHVRVLEGQSLNRVFNLTD